MYCHQTNAQFWKQNHHHPLKIQKHSCVQSDETLHVFAADQTPCYDMIETHYLKYTSEKAYQKMNVYACCFSVPPYYLSTLLEHPSLPWERDKECVGFNFYFYI